MMFAEQAANTEKKMKILLLGEYSNVHNNLAKGLRALGHHVVLANDGDHWKAFSRDIDLSRTVRPAGGMLTRIFNAASGVTFLLRLLLALPRMRGFDVVQIINPVFLPLKAERHFLIYRFLRRHNKKVVMCAMGDDYYYCHTNRIRKPMRYSDYNIGKEEHMTSFARWTYDDRVGTVKERLCRYIASDCDAIIAGAYEYWLPYHLTDDRSIDGRPLREKLCYIPFPFDLGCISSKVQTECSYPIHVFIGISRGRSEFKGTDIMLKAARDLQAKHPGKVAVKIAEGVPFANYQSMMASSDIMLDQLYSYGPGMNALLALAQGLITFTGAEPEHYAITGETECMPLVNVTPSYEDVYSKLEEIVLHPETIPRLRRQSAEYVRRNHDNVKVASRYVEIYS